MDNDSLAGQSPFVSLGSTQLGERFCLNNSRSEVAGSEKKGLCRRFQQLSLQYVNQQGIRPCLLHRFCEGREKGNATKTIPQKTNEEKKI